MGSLATYYMFFGFEISKKEFDIIDSCDSDIFNYVDFMHLGDRDRIDNKIGLYFIGYDYTAEFDEMVPISTTPPSYNVIDVVKNFFNEVEIKWRQPKWYLSGMY